MKYNVVLEKGESSYGAFVPDLPGCIAVAEDREQVLRLLRKRLRSTSKGCGRRDCRCHRRTATSRKWKWRDGGARWA